MQTVATKTYFSRSTSPTTMDISGIVLRSTETTRLVFHRVWAQESEHPLRGGFIFQKKSKNGMWEDIPYLPLTTLKSDESYKLNLSGEEIILLISELSNIQKIYSGAGYKGGINSIRVIPENIDGVFIQITDPTQRVMVEKSINLLSMDQIERLKYLLEKVKLDKVITEFSSNISNNDESFWQGFFENNIGIIQYIFAFPIIFLNGETYLGGKNSNGRQGAGGVATDIFIENAINSSFGVIEIKTPETKLVGSEYRGKSTPGMQNNIYSMHPDFSGGLVQLQNEITTAIENFKLHINEDYPKLNIIDPCGILIIGNKKKLSTPELRSFNLFRKSFGKNQIITFDELLEKMQLMKDQL